MNDLIYSFRSLRRAPGYTAAIVFILALGIGFSTAIFSVVERVLFRTLPYPNPDQLVVLGYTPKSGASSGRFLANQVLLEVAAIRESAHSFQSFAALEKSNVNAIVEGNPVGVTLGRVSLDYFSTLGAVPLIGRSFVPAEAEAGNDTVVVLSHQLWQSRFNCDFGALGRTVEISGRRYRIVGVVGEDFRPPIEAHAVDLYCPISAKPDPRYPFAMNLSVIGRLRSGRIVSEAVTEISRVKLELDATFARFFENRERRVQRLVDTQSESTTHSRWAVLAAVGVLHIIACINATNLMLARLHGRRKELMIRLAVGGSHGQLTRLLATENLLLMAGGGAAGLVVTQWVFPALLGLAPDGGSASADLHINWRAAVFATALTFVTGLIVSTVPMLRLRRTNINAGLSEGGHALGESRRLRARRGLLLVIEVALAVVLLIGAGLMTRTVQRLAQLDRGFNITDKVAVWLELPREAAAKYAQPETRRALYQQLERELRLIPGVADVGITNVAPLAGMAGGVMRKPDGSDLMFGFNAVTPEYQRVLGLSFVVGSWFDDALIGGPPVVVVNETMAREYFGTVDVVGRALASPQGKLESWDIIGVVRDIRERVRQAARPQIYFPYWQIGRPNATSLLLRTTKPVNTAMTDAIRRVVYLLEPAIAVMPPKTLSESAEAQASTERFTVTVLRLLSGLALGLAVAGIFAITAYSVAERRGEFGVRLAFGAVPRQIFRLVLGRSVSLALLGVVVGSGMAWASSQFLQTLLYETSPIDPVVYLAVGVVLTASAVLGTWIPALRAMRVDLIKLLRTE